ncbi:MAG: hypothetical protein AB7H96_02235 [Vicinamibacterales bacterium]
MDSQDLPPDALLAASRYAVLTGRMGMIPGNNEGTTSVEHPPATAVPFYSHQVAMREQEGPWRELTPDPAPVARVQQRIVRAIDWIIARLRTT